MKFLLILFSFCLSAFAFANVAKVEVVVDTCPEKSIWGQIDAQTKCVTTCRGAGGEWTGGWQGIAGGGPCKNKSACGCKITGFVPPPPPAPVRTSEPTSTITGKCIANTNSIMFIALSMCNNKNERECLESKPMVIDGPQFYSAYSAGYMCQWNNKRGCIAVGTDDTKDLKKQEEALKNQEEALNFYCRSFADAGTDTTEKRKTKCLQSKYKADKPLKICEWVD